MNRRGILLSLVALVLLVIQACNSSTHDPQKVGRNKIYDGKLRILTDEGLKPIISQQIEVFEFIHDSVQVQSQYMPDKDMVAEFAKDKQAMMVLARPLTENEKDILKQNDTIYTRQIQVAYDAVAIIGSTNFKGSKLDMAKLKSYFNPTTDTTNGIKMVFDGQNSSTVAYVLNMLGYKDKVSANVYAMHSVDEVIDYVGKNEMAIGFVPFSFVSDTDDDRVKKALKRIKILSLRSVNQKGEEVEVSANQSDIAEGTYPLIRQINVVSRFSYTDNLQWLFMNFLYKERGARIFLKDGLIPARMPPREINVNMDGYKGAN